MRNSKTKKIGELLSEFFEKGRLKTAQKQIDPLTLWTDIMGSQITKETKNINLENNVLYISIKNPYLKSDLKSQSDKILKRIIKVNSSIRKIVFN